MDLKDIHVCVSAYSCDPTRGSEPGIGWNVVREVARRHRVWAVTRWKNQAAISAELARSPLPNLRMVYFDVPTLTAWKRGQIGIELYYRAWQLFTRRLVRTLHLRVGFHITHHVTFGRYWAPTSLTCISAPLIWGPLGGGESAPAAFVADLDLRGRVYEFLRHGARVCGELDPSVRAATRRAAVGVAVTPQTAARLIAMGTKRVEVFSAMGLDIRDFDALSNRAAPPATPVRFVSIGRLLHWKGFHLGLRAFAAAALPGSEYWVIGDGPERARLGDLARRLGIESRVRFFGLLTRSEVLETLAACHVLVHPSLHDSGGWVCLEAMAAAKPVVCLDLGGPAEQVTDATGFKIAPTHPDQAVCDLAQAMTTLGTDAELRAAMGQSARERVRKDYLWERKGERLEALYASALAASKQ
jgi:glycosyltransferase involved in cell wall biosynthesis